MCGLIAWWPRHPDPDDRGYFHRGVRALAPRGPDEEGIWEAPDGSAYLGHRRLRITGESGRQPLWSADGQVAIVVNGEFYDASSMRAQYQAQGYVFATDSDSELLLALYQEHGCAAVEFLEGEFAFVLWDRSKDLVWAVRDRAGVKPLRFIHDARGLAFASEAKALFAAGWRPRWDSQSLAQALSVQYVHPSRTLFAGVEQLAPGESRIFTRTPTGAWQASSSTWWRWFAHASKAHLSHEEAVERLEAHLAHAVARRVETDWPVATHLSGGTDSSAIAWLASCLHPGKVHAYSVGFEAGDAGSPVQHDECAVAERTAQLLGIPWTRVQADRATLLAHWGDAVERSEMIGVNGHLVAKWLLARKIHEDGYRVSLSGEGADETLLGYAFLAAEGADNIETLLEANPVARGVMLPDGEQLDLDAARQSWGTLPIWLQAKATLGARLSTLLDPAWVNDVQPGALQQWSACPPLAGLPVQRAASSWATFALGGYILPALADAPEAGFGIQGRVPFLDRDLMEETQAWDPTTCGWPHTPKAPLRTLLARHGLHEVAQRPKHPFEAPPLWGDASVRQVLRKRWEQASTWEGTPIVRERVVALMDALDAADATTHQLWEPVIATLLSIEQLHLRFVGPCHGR